MSGSGTADPGPRPAGPGSGADDDAAVAALLAEAVDAALAQLRAVDEEAEREVRQLRRRVLVRPSVVLVGEPKRGKSALVNALLGMPDLAPVDVAASTAAYVEFVPGDQPEATLWWPGVAESTTVPVQRLRQWVLAGGSGDQRPPGRVRVSCPAPLLRYVSVVDTPGTGGLDPARTRIALAAAAQADLLLFVAEAAGPLTAPELEFLIEASKRVNTVVFALTKVDAYPGWRTVLADNRALLRARAPRFADARWFPVSAHLAGLAVAAGASAGQALARQSGVAPLQHALVAAAGRGHLLRQANVLRAVRSELVRVDLECGERLAALAPGADQAADLRRQRAAAARRSQTRQWSLALSAQTQRARVAVTARVRDDLARLQEELLAAVDGGDERTRDLPQRVDRELQALAAQLSADLLRGFHEIGEQVLRQAFPPRERQVVLGRLNATLRAELAGRPRREATPDNLMVALSAGGMAFMAGRGVVSGASALGVGAVFGGGLLVPVVGLGLGLAAGAFVLYRRRVHADRQQARVWVREVVAQARARLADEVTQRFTDFQYALTVALDAAAQRRLAELDERVAQLDRAAAREQADRAAARQREQARRDAVRGRLRQVDEVLTRVRPLLTRSGVGGSSS